MEYEPPTKYIIRSKDRVAGGTVNDFVVTLPEFMSRRSNELFVKVNAVVMSPTVLCNDAAETIFNTNSYIDIVATGLFPKQQADSKSGATGKTLVILNKRGEMPQNNPEYELFADGGGIQSLRIQIFNSGTIAAPTLVGPLTSVKPSAPASSLDIGETVIELLVKSKAADLGRTI